MRLLLPHDRPPAGRLAWGLGLCAVTLLGFGLRLTGLEGPSFKIWDDFFALRLALLEPKAILHALAHQPFDAYQEFQPPLYYLLVNAFLGLGKTDAMARLTGVLAGTLSIPALYLLGRRLLDRPAALTGALLLAVNLYHVEYSQQIRNYVLFLCLALWSMHFLAVWLMDRKGWALPGYAVSTAGMLYASYMAVPVIATQGLWWLAALAADIGAHGRKALSRQRAFLAAALLAGLAFAPWLPLWGRMLEALRGITGNQPPPVLETLSVTMREFSAYYTDVLGYPDVALPTLALALLGLAWALTARTKGGLALLVWAGLTLVVVLGFNRQGLHVRTRHLIALLPVLLLLAGAGVSLLARRMKRPWVACLAVIAAVAALNVFNLRVLPDFYRREDDRLKDLCYEMAAFKRDTASQMFWGSDSKWFPDVSRIVTDWYLPGVFKRPDQEFSRAYARAWLISSPQTAPILSAMENTVLWGRRGRADLWLTGVVNTSPLPVVPDAGGSFRFEEGFSSPGSLGLLDGLDNVFLDKGQASLADLSRPGHMQWAMAVPEGTTLTEAALEFEVLFLADVSGLPDSAVRVSAATGQGDFTRLGVFALRELAGNRSPRSLSGTHRVELPANLLQGGARLRLELDPGSWRGQVFIRRMAITARGQSARGGKTTERLRLEHALKNSLVAPQVPGAPLPAGQALYVFATEAGDLVDPARVGGPAEREAFLALNPGLKPVLALNDAGAIHEFYDPGLKAPTLPVPGDYRLERMAGAASAPGWTVWGLSPGGSVMVDGRALPLPGAGDEPAFVEMDGSGAGRIILRPLFVKGSVPAAGASARSGLVQKDGEDCLSCRDASPCQVTYRLTSPVGFTELAVKAYPRVFGDWKLANRWTVSVSTDGQRFETLDTARSNASGRWDGWRVARGAVKKWALPQGDISIRFDLSGDGVQMWSSPEFPMIVQATFAVPGATPGAKLVAAPVAAPGSVSGDSPAALPVRVEALGNGGRIQAAYAAMARVGHLLPGY